MPELGGLLDLRRGHVDAHDLAGPADLESRDERVEAASAAEVEDVLARLQRRKPEVVADARKRIDCRGGDAIEVVRRVADVLDLGF